MFQDPGLTGELSLVSEIIATIERHYGDLGIEACPRELRDTLLTVAGLLHIEAARLYEGEEFEPFEASFLERASISLEKVKWASSQRVSSLLQ
jgi:hypothetical protein